METIRLYDKDAYQIEFDAVVSECREGKKGFEMILDATCFFPEEGGQSADSGTINGIEVTDVQIKNGVITHFTKQALESGSHVHGKINWTERYEKMQQHTGEHILSGMIHREYGYDNVGFHLNGQITTMDMNGYLTEEQLAELERKANQAIYDNVEVIAEYPDKEILAKLEYRSKIEIDGAVRIVTIPGYDRCACCAPHVRRTGEIGMIKIVRSEKYKGGVRLTILCGVRALADYARKVRDMNAMSVLFSVKPEEVAPAAEKLKEELGVCKSRLALMCFEQMKEKLSRIEEGSKNLFLFEEGLENPVQREYVNGLVEKCSGICGVLNGNDDDGYRYIIAARDTDVRPLNEILKEKCQARGGGSAQMVQGSLSGTRKEIEAVIYANV